MRFAQSELREITESVWTSLLGIELQPGPEEVDPSGMQRPMASCVQITGGWQAAVVLYCPTGLALRAAAIMFGVDEQTVAADDIQDVMCELVNIIGGNIKGMLSGSCNICLPTLVQGLDYKLIFPRHLLLSRVSFDCEGQPLLVMLLGEDKSPSRQGDR